MSILTPTEIRDMWRDVFSPSGGQQHFKGANPAIDSAGVAAVFQAIEDFWETNKVALKADMDTAAGHTLTADQAKVMGRAWLLKKARRGN